MNPLDIVIIVILSFCLVRGLFRGLVKELSSIIGVMGGLYSASTFQPEMAKFLASKVPSTPYIDVLSYFILFCGVFIIISFLGVLLKYLLKIAFLGWVDRIFGGLFGAVKGLTIISVVLIGLITFLPKNSSLIGKSKLAPHAAQIAVVMIHMVPQDMKNKFKKRIDKFKDDWKGNIQQKLMNENKILTNPVNKKRS